MDDSVSEWLARLKTGDADAAQKLWARYAHDLIKLARDRLGAAPKGSADEEDIAQAVFSSICRAAAAGRFENVTSRDELWWLLLEITKQKSVDHIRRETAQKRGGGQVHSESHLAATSQPGNGIVLDELIGSSPTPDFLVMLEEQYIHLLGQLRDDRLRQVAVLRIEGYTVHEIAAKLSIGMRSVERKLQLIRGQWGKVLLDTGY